MSAPRRTVFVGGWVFDGSLTEPRRGDIAVADGRIVGLGTDLDGDDAIDVTGMWVAPGFVDCHVHVMMNGVDIVRSLTTEPSLAYFLAARNLRRTLEAGITTIRDAGGADAGVRRAVRERLISGPRMQIAIAMLSQTGGHGDQVHACGVRLGLAPPRDRRTVVDGVEEVRTAVRELIRDGADVIKIATSGGVLSPADNPRHAHFRDAEIATAVEEAQRAGLAVMAHAQGAGGIKAALRQGVRSIEHGVYLDDEAISMMVDRGVWLVPTFHAPASIRATIESGVPVVGTSGEILEEIAEAHRESLARAREAGVKIAMGTDCGVGEHGSNLWEVELMVRNGLSPIEALHGATGSAAQLLGVASDRGTIEPGKRADLVVLDGKPGAVDNLGSRVRQVYLDGALVHDQPPTTEHDDGVVGQRMSQ